MTDASQIIATKIVEDIICGIMAMTDTRILNIEFKKPTFVGRSFPRFTGFSSNSSGKKTVQSQITKRSCEKSDYNPVDKIKKIETEDDCTISRLKKELNVVSSSLRYVTEDRDHWRKACNIARLRKEALSRENNTVTKRITGFEEQLAQQSNICTGIMTGMMEIIWSLTENSSEVSKSLKDFQIQRLLKFSNSVLCTYLSKNDTIAETDLAGAVIGVLVNVSAGGSAVISETDEGIRIIKTLADIVANKSLNPRLCRLSLMFLYNVALQSDIGILYELLPSIPLLVSSQILGKDGQSVAKKLEELLQNEKQLNILSSKKGDLDDEVEQ